MAKQTITTYDLYTGNVPEELKTWGGKALEDALSGQTGNPFVQGTEAQQYFNHLRYRMMTDSQKGNTASELSKKYELINSYQSPEQKQIAEQFGAAHMQGGRFYREPVATTPEQLTASLADRAATRASTWTDMTPAVGQPGTSPTIQAQPTAPRSGTLANQTGASPTQQPQGAQFLSLVDIWDQRKDLQKEFPTKSGGISAKWDINDWWNLHGPQEYPGVTLVQPGDPRITLGGTTQATQGTQQTGAQQQGTQPTGQQGAQPQPPQAQGWSPDLIDIENKLRTDQPQYGGAGATDIENLLRTNQPQYDPGQTGQIAGQLAGGIGGQPSNYQGTGFDAAQAAQQYQNLTAQLGARGTEQGFLDKLKVKLQEKYDYNQDLLARQGTLRQELFTLGAEPMAGIPNPAQARTPQEILGTLKMRQGVLIDQLSNVEGAIKERRGNIDEILDAAGKMYSQETQILKDVQASTLQQYKMAIDEEKTAYGRQKDEYTVLKDTYSRAYDASIDAYEQAKDAYRSVEDAYDREVERAKDEYDRQLDEQKTMEDAYDRALKREQEEYKRSEDIYDKAWDVYEEDYERAQDAYDKEQDLLDRTYKEEADARKLQYEQDLKALGLGRYYEEPGDGTSGYETTDWKNFMLEGGDGTPEGYAAWRKANKSTSITVNLRELLGDINAFKSKNATLNEIKSYVEISGYTMDEPEIAKLLKGYKPTEKDDDKWTKFWSGKWFD